MIPAYLNPLIVALSTLFITSLQAEEEVTAVTWKGTIGTHYRLDTDNFLGTARGVPRWANIGFRPDVSQWEPVNLEPTTGYFSGEPRYYSFENEVFLVGNGAEPDANEVLNEDALDADALDALARKKGQKKSKKNLPISGEEWQVGINYIDSVRAADEAGVDLVIHTGEISPHRASAEYNIPYLMDNSGAYFKDTLYEAYKQLNTGDLANRQNTIYWEIGNEVNSSHRFSLRDISDGKVVRGHPQHAHDYVEYYLAPAVVALRQAATDIHGDPSKVKIMMGNISGILKPENQRYLDLILDTTIEGEHAPSLAGKKVSEVIDIAVIHYSNGQRDLLQGIYDKWVATGKVPDLWSTEELGWRGRGDYAVANVSFAWLDFVLDNIWEEGASPRVIFWGDEAKHYGEVTRGSGALEILGPFLADYPLTRARDEVVPETRADLQWVVIRADSGADEVRYAIHVHPYFVAKAALKGFTVSPDLGALTDDTIVEIDCHMIAMGEENSTLNPKVTKTGDSLFVSFDPLIELEINQSLVFLLTIQQPSVTPEA